MYHCKSCKEQFEEPSKMWVMKNLCPLCNSPDIELIHYLPIGLEIKIVEPGSDIGRWLNRVKPYLKKKEE